MSRQAEPYDDIVDRAYFSGLIGGAIFASAGWVIALAVMGHWIWRVI